MYRYMATGGSGSGSGSAASSRRLRALARQCCGADRAGTATATATPARRRQQWLLLLPGRCRRSGGDSYRSAPPSHPRLSVRPCLTVLLCLPACSLLAGTAAAAAAQEFPEAGTGPGGQGFGPRSRTQPPHFACADIAGAKEFFDREGVSTSAHTTRLCTSPPLLCAESRTVGAARRCCRLCSTSSSRMRCRRHSSSTSTSSATGRSGMIQWAGRSRPMAGRGQARGTRSPSLTLTSWTTARSSTPSSPSSLHASARETSGSASSIYVIRQPGPARCAWASTMTPRWQIA